jgi:hypothetical protein
MSTGTLLYSCGTSSRVIFRLSEESRPSFLRVTPDQEQEITFSLFVSMIIIASSMLLILFYFASSIIIFLKCMITFSAFFSLAFTIWDWFALLIPNRPGLYLTVATSIVVSLTWFVTEHWIVANFIAFCVCCAAVTLIKVHRLFIVLVVSLGFLIYDVYWVFISPAHFGKSVMVEAAMNAAPHMPVAFTVPRAGGKAMIGAGDVVFPAIILDFFMRFDTFHNSSLFVIGFIGYCCGVVIASVAVHLMQKGQPALLWIFPAVLLPVLATAAWQGLLGDMWTLGALDPVSESGRDIGTDPDEREIERALAMADERDGGL